MVFLVFYYRVFDLQTNAGLYLPSRSRASDGVLNSVAKVAKGMESVESKRSAAANQNQVANKDRSSVQAGVHGPATVPGVNIKYTMPPHKRASQQKKNIDIFVGIAAKEGNDELRASIRKTYKQKFGGRNWKFLFFMGKPKGFLVQSEAKRHQDIVFVDVEPEYREEPKIVYAIMHAATQMLGNPRWVIKSDENTYINYDAVLKTLQRGGAEDLTQPQEFEN